MQDIDLLNDSISSISRKLNSISDKSSNSVYKLVLNDQGFVLRKKTHRENDSINLQNDEFSLKKDNKIKDVSKNEKEESKEIIKDNEKEIPQNKISTDDETLNKQKSEKISERQKQKDNFSIKLFKSLNDWILQTTSLNEEERKIKPNYNVFTHNTNLVDIYIFLDIKYKNLLCMTPEDKEALNELLNELKIKKQRKKKKIPINENSKEKDDINQNIKEINSLAVKLLQDKGLNDPKEVDLYKKDIDDISKPLKQNNLKRSRHNQEKNKNILKDLEIKEVNMTLRELIIQFYKSSEFAIFRKKVEYIDEAFKKQKKNKYSLLDKDEYNGFIRMIEEDCNLSKNQKDIIKDFTNYFSNEELNEEEIKKYKEKFFSKKNG
jgi:hypothetical protein